MKIIYEYDYVKKIKEIYRDARWEAYYDMAILPLLEQCCPDGIKCVPVHETRKSGRKSKEYRKHFIETYSGLTLWLKKGKMTLTRTGIPDFVIVSNDSTYDNPKEALVNIELKIPNNVTGEYVQLSDKNPEIIVEIKHQLTHCKYIILTDCITWYFIRKNRNKENGFETIKKISLYDNDKREWKKGKKKLHSEGEVEFYKKLNFEFDENEEVECDPPEWEELLKSLRIFINNINKIYIDDNTNNMKM